MDYIQVDSKKVPWVFWIQVKRRKWFKKLWRTRGANFLDVQFFCLYISIGRPWNKNKVRYELSQHGNLETIKKTNEENLKNTWAILINPN